MFLIKFLPFSIIILIIFNSKIVSNDDNVDVYTKSFVKNFNEIYSLSKYFAHNHFLPYFQRLSSNELNITKQCRDVLISMLANPEQEWSALMLDANGRLIRPGFLSGTITDYGDYDQCLDIDFTQKISTVVDPITIQGRYCLMTLRPPIPPPGSKIDFSHTSYYKRWPSKWFGDPRYRFYYRIVSGICLPAQCHQKEIELLASKAFKKKFDLSVQVEACQSKAETVPLDFAQKFSLCILTLCTVAVLIGSFVDWNQRGKVNCHNENCSEFWTSFSLIRNTESLFTINGPVATNPSNTTIGSNGPQQQPIGELAPIHGLRFLLIMWVITCHTTNFAPLGLYDQPMIASRFAQRIQIVREFWTQFVISGSLSVQAFFIISGMISLHTALKNRQTFIESVPYWKYILLRWLRFAPPLLGMFCYQFLWPLLGSGPMMHWDYLRYGHKPCYQSWWANFLFISNWLKLVDQCGSHTWFLSADFQINLIAYFLIYLYVRNQKLGFRINMVALVVASIVPTLINWYFKVPLVHILEPDMEKLNLTFNMIEFNTYNHFAAYLAGLLIASMLNNPRFSINGKTINLILWPISMILVILIPFSTYPFIQMEEIPSTFLPMIYTGLKRLLWIMAISWILYASCNESRNSLVARFLSAKVFQPFSRLTFCIYLTQSLVVWYYAYQSRELHSISHYNSIFRIGGNTLYSFIFAYILYLLFEAPSVNICRIVFKRQQHQQQSRKTYKSNRKTTAKNHNLDQNNNFDQIKKNDAEDMKNLIPDNQIKGKKDQIVSPSFSSTTTTLKQCKLD